MEDKYKAFRIPGFDATDEEINDYLDRYFDYESAYRCSHMARMSRNIHYTLGNQWIEPDFGSLFPSGNGYAWRSSTTTGFDEMPRPVTNYIAPSVEVEHVAITKRELVPNVIPSSRDPRIEAATRVAKDVLEYRLHANNWPEKREYSAFLYIVCGTTILKSSWDETYRELTTVPSLDAVVCLQCEIKLASATIKKDQLDLVVANRETIKDTPEEEPSNNVVLTNCPICQGSALQHYEPSPDELTVKDMFGRPLGSDVTKGNTNLEVVSCFDAFPQNGGVGVTPADCRVMGQSTPRDMDWIEEHWPDVMEDIEAESPEELLRYHPILSTGALLGTFTGRDDGMVYSNHSRVQELHCKPTFRFPLGRSLVRIVGGSSKKIVENGELHRKVTTPLGEIEVSKVEFGAARFKIRPGEFWGQALVDLLISPQNRLNGTDAQEIEILRRLATPNILIPEDCAQGPEWREAWGGGKFLRYALSAVNQQAKPEIFGGVSPPQGLFAERNNVINDIHQLAGPADIEMGEAPKNITTTSGLQLLGEAAERRRAPRERALIYMYEIIWRHQLDMLWGFRADPDSYWVDNPGSDTWEERQFDRSALLGQTYVRIEKQANIDKGFFQSAGVREGQADGLIQPNSQAAIKKMLEYRNLPTDINADLNYQVDRAKEQWVDFSDFGLVPVIDETLDDPAIRYQTLGTFLLSDAGMKKAKLAGWPEIVEKLAGWELELQRIEALDAQVVAAYGGRLPKAQAEEMYATMTIAYQDQLSKYQAASVLSQEAGIPFDAPPPTEPPPPFFLPAALNKRILGVWKGMLQAATPVEPQLDGAALPVEPGLQPEQEAFLGFRAAYETYRLLTQRKQLGAPTGNPANPGGTPPLAGGQPQPESAPFGQPPNPPNPANPISLQEGA